MKTYDFKQVAVIIGGRQMTGFAEGDDVVKVGRDEDAFTMTVGADGEGTRSKSNNKAGKLTIKLKAASESNQILDGFALADELGNAGLVPFLVKDNSGATLHAAEQSYIVKRPESALGMSEGEREWILQTDNLAMFEGGN